MTVTSVPQGHFSGARAIAQAPSGADTRDLRTILNQIVALANQNESDIGTLGSPLQLKGSIAAAASFPTVAAVQPGWTYLITADVTDNDPTKTNTGKSFKAGDEIAWDGSTWEPLGINPKVSIQNTTPLTVGSGNIVWFIDTATIAGACAIALPAVSAGLIGKVVVFGDYSARAGSYNVAISPDGTDNIDGVNAPVNLTKNGEVVALQCMGAAGWKTMYRSTPNDRSFTISAVAPTVNEDVLTGYYAGSGWFDSVTGRLYFCTDASVGAAVWANLSNVVAGGASGLMTGADKTKLNALSSIQSYHADVTLQVDESEVSAALSGLASENVFIDNIIVVFKSSTGVVAGDATLNVGTSSDGTEITSAEPMTGLSAGKVLRINLGNSLNDNILGNATIYVNVEKADSTATTLVVDVYVMGRKF